MKRILVVVIALIVSIGATQIIAGGTTGATDPPSVPVCHKAGTPAAKTLWVPASAVAGHLGHLDTEGVCGETPV